MLFYQVDAFTNKPFYGNPAGVVLDSTLTVEQKYKIAREINLSVTAFVSNSEKADFKIDYFTPKKEIPISGHATIAAFWVLAEIGRLKREGNKAKATVETDKGLYTIEVKWKSEKVDRVYMLLDKPEFTKTDLEIPKLAELLGINPAKIEANEKLPLIIASTGSPKLLVLITSKEMTDALVPNYDELERLCRRLKVTGIHLYTFDTYLEGSNCYTRHFEPIRGLPETATSGLANGALGAFLVKKGFAPPGTLIIEQGESLDRAGKVEVKVKATQENIKSVKIGGKARVIFSIELQDVF
ncbi:MAG: PhzF family phenazine biosynthesis protein [Candidatus Heimdallarchaeota archaeon]